MRGMEILEALDFIDGKYINEAKTNDYISENKKEEKRFKIPLANKKWLSPVAAILAVVILSIHFLLGGQGYVFFGGVKALASAEYPVMTAFPDVNDPQTDFLNQYKKWREDLDLQESYFGYGKGLDKFIMDSAEAFLSDKSGENTVYSPMNIYMTLSMIAEMSRGETRTQALSVLKCNNIYDLRNQTNAIWNANYRDDGIVKSVLASSLWLNNKIEYDPYIVSVLANKYYASVFEGKMGSSEYKREYYSWLNQQTGGLFMDQLASEPFNKNSVMTIASTISYEAKWMQAFSDSRTKTGYFNTEYGSVKCEYMSKTDTQGRYFWGNGFTATSKPLKDSGSVYFILPNEGTSVSELLKSEEALRFIASDGKWENMQKLTIELNVPKMDVASHMDIREALSKMGVTDCFDKDKADFSTVTDSSYDGKGLYITDAEHGVRVSINEEGCTGTAFTSVSDNDPPASEEAERTFTIDKPFIFVITGADGLPLFIGTVYQPITQ